MRGIGTVDGWVAARAGIAAPTGRRLDATGFRRRLQEYQLRRLRESLERAKRASPFYAQHLAGVVPGAIRSLGDIRHIPTLSGADLVAAGPEALCVAQGEISRIVTLESSGTTGQAKRLFFTDADLELTVDFFAKGMGTFTATGEAVLILLPGNRRAGIAELLARALRKIGAEPVLRNPADDVVATLELMERRGVACAVASPVQALALVRASEELRSGPPSRFRRFLLSTDYVPQALRESLERGWGCESVAYFGMSELGYGGGIECGARAGYHLYEGDFYAEVVDPASGTPLPDGVRGELVVTTLTRDGLPLIRYRTGDSTRIMEGDCPCGSPLRRMDAVRSRLGGVGKLRTGAELRLSDLDEALFAVPGLIDYKAALDAGADRDRLILKARVLPSRLSGSAARCRAALHSVEGIGEATARGLLELELSVAVESIGAVPVGGKRILEGCKGD